MGRPRAPHAPTRPRRPCKPHPCSNQVTHADPPVCPASHPCHPNTATHAKSDAASARHERANEKKGRRPIQSRRLARATAGDSGRPSPHCPPLVHPSIEPPHPSSKSYPALCCGPDRCPNLPSLKRRTHAHTTSGAQPLPPPSRPTPLHSSPKAVATLGCP